MVEWDFHPQTSEENLRPDRAVVDWLPRKQLAREMLDELQEGNDVGDCVYALRQLAGDQKWEVRLAIAEQLLVLPDEVFEWFAERFAQDVHRYVRRAAERAIKHRRRENRKRAREMQQREQLDRRIKRLEAQVGQSVVARALQICQSRTDQVIGSLIHDIRSIQTSLEASWQAAVTDKLSSRRAERMSEQLRLLEQLLRDAESLIATPSEVRCSERLHNVVVEAVEIARESVWKGQLDPTSVEVRVDVSESIVFPIARHLILIALVNVIKNAHESFVHGAGALRSGTIRIWTEHCRDVVSLVIADNGSGMSEEELAKVRSFLPGRRNKAKRYSTGYGLPIAARNLNAHGGTIEISSREDEGTTVTITLPLTSNDEEERNESQSLGRRRRRTHRRGN